MDKLARIAILNDLYGGLLTKKQQEVLDLSYNQDYSLGEIAQLLNITRQGVHDNINRSQKMLEHYETNLGLLAKFEAETINQEQLADKLNQAIANKDWQLVAEVAAGLKPKWILEA